MVCTGYDFPSLNEHLEERQSKRASTAFSSVKWQSAYPHVLDRPDGSGGDAPPATFPADLFLRGSPEGKQLSKKIKVCVRDVVLAQLTSCVWQNFETITCSTERSTEKHPVTYRRPQKLLSYREWNQQVAVGVAGGANDELVRCSV